MTTTLNILRQRRQHRNRERSSAARHSTRVFFAVGLVLSAVGVVLVVAGALAYASLTRGLPPITELEALLNPVSGSLLQPTRLYDRSGEHLIDTLSPDGANRTYIPYPTFPKALVDATLALIEPDFWSSPGYSINSWQDSAAHPTLAQQLVSDLLLWNQDASPLRAIHERMLAAQITARYGRQQVLEWYLNSANYGHLAYGAEAAARLYFGKPVSALDLSESALLASVSLAPALNPLDAPAVAEQRRVQTLMVMQGLGWLTEEQAGTAISAPPVLAGGTGTRQPGIAPALASLILSQLEGIYAGGRVERGGLVILTSLDYDLQLNALCMLQNGPARLGGETAEIPAADGSPCQAARLLPTLQGGESLPDANASALMLDPQTGQVLAVVGDLSGSGAGSILASHPAGTAITPFIYLTGFTRGLNPATLVWDVPSQNPVPGQVYHGPMRARVALAGDNLIPAQGVLAQMGLESVRSIAAPFGLNLPGSLLAADFDLSPLDLASAYAVFASGGIQAGQLTTAFPIRPSAVLKVLGADSSLWLDWAEPQNQTLLSPQLAYLMNQVLSDETARWSSLGHPNPLEIGRPAGAKLSSSLDGSSAWAVGYTPQRLVVIHVQGAGSNPRLPIYSANFWHALMQYAVRDLPPTGWEMPEGIVTLFVCDPSGMLPTAVCPNVVSEAFLEGRQPVQTDTLYQTFQVNQETGMLATVFTPSELVENHTYMVVPPQARLWADEAGIPAPPSSYDTLQTPPTLPDVHITSPAMFSDGRGILRILGTARGADFSFYRLEFGQGLYPTQWLQIGDNSTSERTESLLGEWDTTGLNGLYALRLMVVRSDRRVDQAVLQITLDNTPPRVAITYPLPNAVLSLASEPQVALQAQVNDPFLVKVEFYVDDSKVGVSEVFPYGVIWKAVPGSHSLRVIASDRAGNTSEASLSFTVR